MAAMAGLGLGAFGAASSLISKQATRANPNPPSTIPSQPHDHTRPLDTQTFTRIVTHTAIDIHARRHADAQSHTFTHPRSLKPPGSSTSAHSSTSHIAVLAARHAQERTVSTPTRAPTPPALVAKARAGWMELTLSLLARFVYSCGTQWQCVEDVLERAESCSGTLITKGLVA